MTEPSSSAVEQAVQARIAKVRAEGERRRQERAEFAAARATGLGYRHAARLRNLATPADGAANNPDEEALMPAALRSIHCPACRCERLARLMTTTTVGGTPYDVLRCAAGDCDLLWLVRADRPRTTPAAA